MFLDFECIFLAFINLRSVEVFSVVLLKSMLYSLINFWEGVTLVPFSSTFVLDLSCVSACVFACVFACVCVYSCFLLSLISGVSNENEFLCSLITISLLGLLV